MVETCVIGVGGTGSRCVESFVHLCAAGLGPSNTWIGLVDQDRANGNVERTIQTIRTYQDLRGQLRQLETHKLADDCGLLRTNIQLPSGSPLWCPLQAASSTLESIFRADILKPELKGLFDCLYAESEHSMELDVGFRGKPHIGAASILSQSSSDGPFWSDLQDIIQSTRTGREVRIFLMGSIFGGMGASGFPTIARRLRKEVREAGGNVKISGALFLPYFMFSSPDDNQDQDVARSTAFLEQTHGALYFYENLLRREPDILDSLYLLGWSPLINLGYHEKGGQRQVNPPMIPELYGALAAAHSFKSDDGGESNIYQIGRDSSDALTWDDIPTVGGDENEVRSKVSQLIRFATAYLYIYRPALSGNPPKTVRSESWYRRLLEVQGVDPTSVDRQEALEAVDQYCAMALKWIASLEFYGSDQTNLDLIKSSIFAKEAETENKFSAELRGAISQQGLRDFSKLSKSETEVSLAKIFDKLTYASVNAGHKGLGVFCGSLFDFSKAE
jgi:hypothetical protein